MTDEQIVESSPTDQQDVEQDVSQAESSTAPVDTAENEQKDEKSNVQKRINKLTREKYEAQNKAKDLEDKYQALEERINAMDRPAEKPRYDQFDSDEAYEAALTDYVHKTSAQSARQAELEAAQRVRLEDQQRAAQQRQQDYNARAAKEADRYEGYWDAVNDPAFSAIVTSMDPQVVALVQESDKSTGLGYYLATNLEVADQIANMPVATAARELLKIEVGLEKPESKKISDAPPPVEPIGSSGQNELPLDKVESTEEWMARRNAQIRGRNG